jgi:hypothetical protein
MPSYFLVRRDAQKGKKEKSNLTVVVEKKDERKIMYGIITKLYSILFLINVALITTNMETVVLATPRTLSTVRNTSPVVNTTWTTTTNESFDRSSMTTSTSSSSATNEADGDGGGGGKLCQLFRLFCPQRRIIKKRRKNDSNGCCILRNKTKDRIMDEYGNRYGKFEGVLIEQLNRTTKSQPYRAVTHYTRAGITSSYPEAFCGNVIPVRPTSVRKGVIRWMEMIDYGTCDAARVVLGQVRGNNDTWINWYGFTNKTFPRGTGAMNWTCLPCNML